MKLVRSRIPEIDRATGGTGVFRPVADATELDRLLDAKLDEEIAEWRESGDPEELADVLAVVEAVAAHRGIGWGQLYQLKRAKAIERGGFLDGIVWIGSSPEPRRPVVTEASDDARRAAAADFTGGLR